MAGMHYPAPVDRRPSGALAFREVCYRDGLSRAVVDALIEHGVHRTGSDGLRHVAYLVQSKAGQARVTS